MACFSRCSSDPFLNALKVAFKNVLYADVAQIFLYLFQDILILIIIDNFKAIDLLLV